MKRTLLFTVLFSAAAVVRAVAQDAGTVTIFPFESGSGRAQEGRAAEITRLMAAALGRDGSFRVVQAQASGDGRGRPTTAQGAGTRFAVMGAILLSRGTLRIDARLIDVQQSAIVVRDNVIVPEADFVASPEAVVARLADKLRAGMPSRPETGSDSVAVITAVTAFHDALAAGDSTVALRMLATDAVVIENDSVQPRDAWRAGRLPTALRYAQSVRATRAIRQVTISGSTAWLAASLEVTGTYRGQPVSAFGTELVVLSREGEVWRIRAIHWTTRDRPEARPATVPQ